jgi:hypothetical protein
MEASGHALLEGRPRQQVAGELFDGELIEWQVAVEGLDDPLPKSPSVRPRRVFFVAIAIAVAG